MPTTIIFERSPEGVVVRGGFPPVILVHGSLLDLFTRGKSADGSTSVRGHIEPVAGNITRTVWDSITFTCVNGEATYDFVEQDDEDWQRDVWRGVRRNIVDSTVARMDD